MPLSKERRKALVELMRQANVLGVAMAEFDQNKVETNEFGETSELGPSVNKNTVFGAASLSKPVFAYLVNHLARDPQYDQFTLDTPLHTILEDKEISLHSAHKELTARLILSHQSGWPNKPSNTNGEAKFQFQPGTAFAYSGVPYGYLQQVIETVTGMSLEECAKKYVFHPCGMKNTTFTPPDSTLNTHPANSLFTTAGDYALFCQAAFKHEELFDIVCPLSPERDKWAANQGLSKEDLQKVAWGLGWGLQTANSTNATRAFHYGDMNQWRTFVALDLEKRTGVVYFSNSSNGLILADTMISSTVELDDGLKFVFEKFGFARKIEPEWQEKERIRIDKIIMENLPDLWIEIQESRSAEALAERLQDIMTTSSIPAMSYASSNGEALEVFAYGSTNARPDPKNEAYPVTPETVFQAASLSKPVFAYLVLNMANPARRGGPLIDLDTPLSQISKKGFGNPAGQYQTDPRLLSLTPRMILSHQASLPNEGPDEFLESKPGTSFDYSGLAYCMLGEVLEEVSEKRLESIAQEAFASIGMTSTSFLMHEVGSDKREKRAIGHDFNHTPNPASENFVQEHPGASLITTAQDYQKFMQACVTDPYIKQNMFAVQVDLCEKDHKAIEANVPQSYLRQIGWGLGIGLLVNDDGHTIAFHWGDINVSRSFTAYNLNTNQGVSCFTNSAHGPAIFSSVTESVGDLSVVWAWLSKRESLPLRLEPTSTESMPSSSSPSVSDSSPSTMSSLFSLTRSKSVTDLRKLQEREDVAKDKKNKDSPHRSTPKNSPF